MPSASGKGRVTEIRLAFLPQNSPYPSPLSPPKKKKIKGIKYHFSRHWKSGSERWETNKVSPTLGPAYCFQSFQAEHKEGIWGQLLGLWRCCWVSMESKAARVHRTHLVMREMNRENPGIWKAFLSGSQLSSDMSIFVEKCPRWKKETLEKIMGQCLVFTWYRQLYSLPKPDETTHKGHWEEHSKKIVPYYLD